MEMLNGNVAEHVEVDAARLPARAPQVMVVSAPVSAVMRRLGMVPSGIFAAAKFTFTALAAAIITSGLRYCPAACGGTATPFTVVMVREGAAKVEFAGGR